MEERKGVLDYLENSEAYKGVSVRVALLPPSGTVA
jgi:hypothetical protein